VARLTSEIGEKKAQVKIKEERMTMMSRNASRFGYSEVNGGRNASKVSGNSFTYKK